MKTQEIIKALRSTPSRSKRMLLDEAADKLKELQAENDRLIRSMLNPSDDKSESGLLEE